MLAALLRAPAAMPPEAEWRRDCLLKDRHGLPWGQQRAEVSI